MATKRTSAPRAKKSGSRGKAPKPPAKAEGATLPFEIDPKKIEESLGTLRENLMKWARKGRFTKVRFKFRGKPLLPDVPLAAVLAVEGITFYWTGLLRALVFNLAGKTVFEVELVNDSEKQLTRGKEALLSGDLDEAFKNFSEAIAMDHDNPAVHLNLGIALKLKGDHAAARASFTTAKKLDPEGQTGAEAERLLATLPSRKLTMKLQFISLEAALLFIALAVATGCASGPRPMPEGATADERLRQMEGVVSSLTKNAMDLQLEATGSRSAKLTGSLEFSGKNQVHLKLEGTHDKDTGINLEADSRQGALNRTLSMASTSSSHQDPPSDSVGQVFAVSLARSGLFKLAESLIADEPIAFMTGGIREAMKSVAPSESGTDTVNGQACHRVSTTVQISGTMSGTTSVCISDSTSLPLVRNSTLSVNGAEAQVTERYTWK